MLERVLLNAGGRAARLSSVRRMAVCLATVLTVVTLLLQAAADPTNLLGKSRSPASAGAAGPKFSAPRAGSAVPHVASRPKGRRFVQLGVDVWWSKTQAYDTPARELGESEAIIKDVVGYLHANSVALAFPVFDRSTTSNRVYRSAATPSTDDLRILIQVAQAAGLNVELRPMIQIGANGWEGLLQPSNRHRFLMSYYYAVRPYLVLAQQMHVSTFIYASEWLLLSSNSAYAGWFAYMVDLMRHWYTGRLVYDESGMQYLPQRDVTPDRSAYGLHTDAYWPAPEPDNLTASQLEFWWYLYLSRLPAMVRAQTVLQEVGFDAGPGGYRHPSLSMNPPTDTHFLWMQENWFSMVCAIVHRFNMRGVYFWRLNFNFDPATTTSDSSYLSGNDWVSRIGAATVSRCFATFYTR